MTPAGATPETAPGTAPATPIVPVILSGGSGTRLWPASDKKLPKQFLALTADETMLQLTVKRTLRGSAFSAPLIVANAAHADMVESQLAAVGIDDALVLPEPFGRNTAPAIALAALAAKPDAALLVMPSDHVIADLTAFHAAIATALPLIADNWLVTFGITPDAPETGYGYIRMGDPLAQGVHKVARFVEKPDTDTASAMLAEGGYAWNAGIFLFRADAYLAALGAFQPAMLAAARAAMDKGVRTGNRLMPDAEAFAASPADSIDYAVMERTEKVACVPVAMGWSDVGSWDSLHMISDKDDAGNATHGDILSFGAKGCLAHSDGPRVSLVGVKDLIVVVAQGEVIVLPRGQSQDVRKVAEALQGK